MSLSALLFIIGEAKSVTPTVVSYFVGNIFHRSSQGLKQGWTSLVACLPNARNFCTPSLQNIQLYGSCLGLVTVYSFFASMCVCLIMLFNVCNVAQDYCFLENDIL
jgi:hypothetical protein